MGKVLQRYSLHLRNYYLSIKKYQQRWHFHGVTIEALTPRHNERNNLWVGLGIHFSSYHALDT